MMFYVEYIMCIFVSKIDALLRASIHTKEGIAVLLWRSGPDGSRTHFRTPSLDFLCHNHYYRKEVCPVVLTIELPTVSNVFCENLFINMQ